MSCIANSASSRHLLSWVVLVVLAAGFSSLRADGSRVKWTRLSSVDGLLPSPPGADELTASVVDDVDGDGDLDIVSIRFDTTGFASPVTDGRLYFWLADDARGGDVYSIDQVTLTPVGAVGTANLTLNVAAHGQGSVSRDPDAAYYEAGTQVELTAQAADGWVFESWGGDAASTANPLTVTVNEDLQIDAFFLPADEQSIIDVWYGDEQTFGEIGVPQSQVNILGNVAIDEQLQSLTYSLDGVAKGELSTGPDDNIRLARAGDFNIEIPFTDLAEGQNQVTIEATRIDGKVFSKTVTVRSSLFNVWPQPYSIEWSSVSRINDVAQVVDGKWQLTPDGVRVAEAHYDRVIALGDIEWTDYEVTVPITVHEVFPQDPPFEPLVGVMLRWDGHEKRFFVEQLGTEWRPIGAMGVHGWYTDGPRGGPHFQIFETGSIKFPGYSGMTMDLNTPYYFKFRVESKPGAFYGFYSFKVWKAGQPEPSAWGITRQAEQGLSKGSALLVAHYVDATFGDIVVTLLAADDEAPSAPQNLRASLLGSGDVSLTWDQSSDNTGVASYRVLRDGSPLADVAGAAHIDSTVVGGASYRYAVVARDAVGNTSSPSNEVAIATDSLPDPSGDLWLGMGFEEEGGRAVVDTSPHGNDGILDELALRSESGRFGRALEFGGAGGQVDLGGLDIPGSAFTIAVWIKPDAFAIHDARILSKASGVDENDHFWMLSTISSNGIKPRVRLKAGSGRTQTLIGSSEIPAGQWTHLAATYNGSRLRLYVNGSLDASLAISGSIAQNAAVPAAIGNQAQGGRSFDGVIDDLRIYLGALDASEISSLMTEPVADPQPAFNALANGGFESGMESWSFYTSGSGESSVSGSAYVGAGAAKLSIHNSASNIQLYQKDVPLEPNAEYRLTFAAYSNSGRDLRVALQKHSSPHSNYGLSRVRQDLSTGWQSFSIDFTTTNFSFPVNDGRLYFWLGDDARAGDVYYIDQVQLAPVNAAR